MDRRLVLAGLAGLAATRALAQTNQSPATTRPGASGGAASGAAMTPAAGQMSSADMQHMQQTLQLGMVALETSRIAQQKAENADLKQFAGFEVQEQMTLSEVLHSMVEPTATAATGTTPQASSNMASRALQMDAQGRDMLQKLQSAQAGAEFDRQYLQGADPRSP